MNIKSQRIQEVDRYKLPVFLKIREHLFVAVTVLFKVSLNGRRLQCRGQKETTCERQQHTVCDFTVTSPHQKKRHQKCEHHSQQKIQGNLLIIFTDGKIQHRIKYKYERNIPTESRKHKKQMNASGDVFSHTERNAEKAA